MKNKKILLVNEDSRLSTGYAVHGCELLKRWHKAGYEVAELAVYPPVNGPSYPWKWYSNSPQNQKEQELYNKLGAAAEFGYWKFEEVCLDFQPDICCTPGSLVFTENGYKAIEDIKEGELVLTHKGRFRKVTKTFERDYSGIMHNFKVAGSCVQLSLTTNHPIFALKKRNQTNQKKSIQKIYNGIEPDFIASQDVVVGDMLTCAYFKEGSQQKIYKDIILDEDVGRLSGYIIGDGIYNDDGLKIIFDHDEESFAEDALFILNNKFKANATIKRGEKYDTYQVIISNQDVANFFKDWLGNDMNSRHIPREVWLSSTNVKWGFLTGMICADGNYAWNTIKLNKVNPQVAYEGRQLFFELGIPATINLTSAGRYYAVEVHGKYAELVHSIIEKKKEGISTPEYKSGTKHGHYVNHINGRMIFSVKNKTETHYSGKVYNIEVEEDNSYVVNHCTVHNCAKITDPWMSLEHESPFADIFHFIYQPTVDSAPQNEDWLGQFEKADKLFTFSNFATDLLNQQLKTVKGKMLGVAPICADTEVFKPMNRKEARAELGIPPDAIVIGTVMRNQKRKLYPDLLEAFHKLVSKCRQEGRDDLANRLYLHIHCYWPDMGWDFPRKLREFGGNRVLFTYYCQSCKQMKVRHFAGQRDFCETENCMSIGPNGQPMQSLAELPGVHCGVTREDLAKIYNGFDLYVQYCNCLHPDSKVLLKRGWTRIEDVKVGDEAWTHNKRWKKVLNTFKYEKGDRPLELKLCGDRIPLTITSQHKVWAITNDTIKKAGYSLSRNPRQTLRRLELGNKAIPEPEFIPAENLKRDDLLVYQINDEVVDVDFITIPDRQDYMPEKVVVDDLFCKWLGLYVADGTATTKKDPRCEAVDTAVYCKALTLWLRENCDKLENKRFPGWILYLPLEKQKKLLQGLFMGDGTWNPKKESCGYSTISVVLAEQISFMLKRLRIPYTVHRQHRGGTRKDAWRFEVQCNIKGGDFTVSKSKNSAMYYLNDRLYLKVDTITKSEYDGPVYDFEVEEDHSFTTHLGVVHNSGGTEMPQLEACACGVRVMSTDYSAMKSFVENTDSIPIKVLAYLPEAESGVHRAQPCQEDFVQKAFDFLSQPENIRNHQGMQGRQRYLEYYDWDKTAAMWMKAFDEAPKADWKKPVKLYKKIEGIPPQIFVNGQPDVTAFVDYITSFYPHTEYDRLKLQYNLLQGYIMHGGGYQVCEDTMYIGRAPREQFGAETAIAHINARIERHNQWEQARKEKLGI